MTKRELIEGQRSADAKKACCHELADQVKYGFVEFGFDGTADVKGHCGGEPVLVLSCIRFCPYCSKKLPVAE